MKPRIINIRLDPKLWKMMYKHKKYLDKNWEEYIEYLFFSRKELLRENVEISR